MDDHVVDPSGLHPNQRGQISEAAIALRLIRRGFEVYTPAFDGHKLDLVAFHPPTEKLSKIQVRGISPPGRYGKSLISLRCTDGRYGQRRYADSELDFLIGYSIVDDVAYVFSQADVAHAINAITITEASREAWHKLL